MKRLDHEQLAEMGGLGGLKCVVGSDMTLYSICSEILSQWSDFRTGAIPPSRNFLG